MFDFLIEVVKEMYLYQQINEGKHTVTSCMLYGLRPARVCRENSSSLIQANLSPAIEDN
jgi:hypothetical protein